MGVCAIGWYIPAVVCAVRDGLDGGNVTANLSTAIVVPICLVGGALCYTFHFPECLRPGLFDKLVGEVLGTSPAI